MTASTSAPWKYNLHDPALGLPRNLTAGINTRLVCGEQVMLSVVRLDPHAKSALHHHPEEQWGVLLEGSCVRVQGDAEVSMKPGDFWHTPGNIPHGMKAGPEGALVLDIFSPPRPEYKVPGSGYGRNEGGRKGRSQEPGARRSDNQYASDGLVEGPAPSGPSARVK